MPFIQQLFDVWPFWRGESVITIEIVCLTVICLSSAAARKHSDGCKRPLKRVSHLQHHALEAGRRHYKVFLIRAPHGGSRLSKTDPLRSSPGFGGFLQWSWGAFPRISPHSRWVKASIVEGKKRAAPRFHSAALAPNLCWDGLQWERKAGPHIKHQPGW